MRERVLVKSSEFNSAPVESSERTGSCWFKSKMMKRQKIKLYSPVVFDNININITADLESLVFIRIKTKLSYNKPNFSFSVFLPFSFSSPKTKLASLAC